MHRKTSPDGTLLPFDARLAMPAPVRSSRGWSIQGLTLNVCRARADLSTDASAGTDPESGFQLRCSP
jgi:hypothetical protein